MSRSISITCAPCSASRACGTCDARAAHQPLCRDRDPFGAAHETEIWRALRRLVAASFCRQMISRSTRNRADNAMPCSGDVYAASRSTISRLCAKDPGHGPRGPRDGGESAAVLINARSRTFSPVWLPKREFMNMRKRSGSGSGSATHASRLAGTISPLAATSHVNRDGGQQRLLRAWQDLANERRSDVAMNTPVSTTTGASDSKEQDS